MKRIALYRISIGKVIKLGEIEDDRDLDHEILWDKLIGSVKWYGNRSYGEFLVLAQYSEDHWMLYIFYAPDIKLVRWHDVIKNPFLNHLQFRELVKELAEFLM